MPIAKDVPFATGIEAQRSALRAVLGSGTFSKNPRLAALLEYLCVRCFRGEMDSIKEYTIATDVFGRPPDFDQSSDAIVRVEMHRLRKKLKEFYGGEGAGQTLEIVIQSGRYLPEFSIREKPEDAGNAMERSREQDGLQSVLETAVEWTEPTKPGIKEPIQISRGFLWLAVGGIVVVLGAAIGGLALLSMRHAASGPVARVGGTESEIQPAAVPAGPNVRILCGALKSSFRDRVGNEWGADAFYSGGSAVEVPPQQPIYRTRNQFLFRTMRSGEFTYKIPLKPGVYELRLYFADTSYSPGTAMEGGENVRVFNLMINGAVALRDFDIIADAGPNTADVKVFKDVSPASDGYLHLGFSKVADMPVISAIEIIPGIPHRLRPIRLVTQDSVLIDRTGTTWNPDNYFFSGRTIARFGKITGPEDPEIYGRERYGNFSYAIPVADGRYGLTLHFAETYWGPDGQGGGGIGSRVFDVYCNGSALLRNFDMFKEAGTHHQIVKAFHGLEASAQGKLLVSFVPVKNYANISAIEVTDESK